MRGLTKKSYKNMSTPELIQHSQGDDYDALEELIKREQKNIYASFYYLDPSRHDILDLTQEALLRMSKNIKMLRNTKTFKSWLGQIVSNLFYDELRKKSKSPNLVSIESFWEAEDEKGGVMEISDVKSKPDDKTMHKELDEIIREMISKLPNRFKFAIVLREIQGLSYDEIAKITHTSVGTVKSRISRARNKLQEYLKPYIT